VKYRNHGDVEPNFNDKITNLPEGALSFDFRTTLRSKDE